MVQSLKANMASTDIRYQPVVFEEFSSNFLSKKGKKRKEPKLIKHICHITLITGALHVLTQEDHMDGDCIKDHYFQ